MSSQMHDSKPADHLIVGDVISKKNGMCSVDVVGNHLARNGLTSDVPQLANNHRHEVRAQAETKSAAYIHAS